MLELYDPFSFEIIRQLEAFRFCPDGEGGPFVEDGHIAITGSHPVTTDGGTMSFSHAGTNPQMMQRAIRGVQQIRGDAGELQVPERTNRPVQQRRRRCTVHHGPAVRRRTTMTTELGPLAAQRAAVPHAVPGPLTAPFWQGCAERAAAVPAL